MPSITCPKCGKKYKLPADAGGRALKCPCGARFRTKSTSGVESSAKHPAVPAAAPKFDRFDDLSGDLEVEEPSARPAEFMAAAAPAAPSAAATPADDEPQGWQILADRVFRVMCALAPLVAAAFTYVSIDPNQPNGASNRIIYGGLSLVAAGAIGTILAMKGIRFDRESFKMRMHGAIMIAIAIVCGAIGAFLVYAVLHGERRAGKMALIAYACLGICVFGLVIGLLQVITGHDIRSATKFRTE